MLAPLFVLAWCFVVGACVGSFLNVVAWRLPLGMSLSWPRSHCPRCKKGILFRDNVPVMGWLWLRGRCRSCGQSISARYPLVEFITGAVFALLAYPELTRGGANLPLAAAGLREGQGEFYSFEGLLCLWLYHATLAALLIVTALFERDQARVPRRFVIVGALLGLLPLALSWPMLLQPLAVVGFDAPIEQRWLTSLAVGAGGLLCGAALGWLANLGAKGGQGFPYSGCGYVMLALTLVGAFLGWQAALTTACVASVLLLGLSLAGLATARNLAAHPATITAAIAMAHILAWRTLSELAWPGTYESRRSIGLTVAVIIVACLARAAVERLRRRRLAAC